jgi:demethylmenaquinone methyltransferase / 2-methoxy-6-polyprenyl-1,4-benzoquinol methylase
MTERDYPGPDSRQVREMFAGIAHRYDFLNHFLSVSIDRHWRNIAAAKIRELAGPTPAMCLDACSGTGDLAIVLQKSLQTQVIASDFCHPMLTRANAKFGGQGIRTVEADALRLPFPDAFFDAVTMAFGLRNLEDPHAGLREIRRVLKPRGALAILEFSQPVLPVFNQIYHFYLRHILPALGKAVSGHASAYQYLPDSIQEFPKQKELLALMRHAGFVEENYMNLMGGAVALHWARASF